MNWQDITAIIIACLCGAAALRMIYRSMTKKSSCGCEKCPSASKTQPIGITTPDSIHKHKLN